MVAGFALGASRRASEPTAVDVDHPGGGGACGPDAASRLSDALRALAMLGHHVDPRGTDYWIGRLDAIERRDHEEVAAS